MSDSLLNKWKDWKSRSSSGVDAIADATKKTGKFVKDSTNKAMHTVKDRTVYGNPMDMKKELSKIYGKNLDSELTKAEAYSKKHNLPFNVREGYSKPVRYSGGMKGIPGAYLPAKGVEIAGWSPEDDRIFVGKEPSTWKHLLNDEVVKFPSDDQIRDEVKRHEMAHAATINLSDEAYLHPGARLEEVADKLRIPSAHGTEPIFKEWHTGDDEGTGATAVYPETHPAEVIPPLTALQQHMYKTTGKRIESPEEYDKIIQQLEALPRERRGELPMEIQRLLYYRDTMRETQNIDPGKEWEWDRAEKIDARDRLKNYDNWNRKLIPGLAKTSPVAQEKTASIASNVAKAYKATASTLGRGKDKLLKSTGMDLKADPTSSEIGTGMKALKYVTNTPQDKQINKKRAALRALALGPRILPKNWQDSAVRGSLAAYGTHQGIQSYNKLQENLEKTDSNVQGTVRDIKNYLAKNNRKDIARKIPYDPIGSAKSQIADVAMRTHNRYYGSDDPSAPSPEPSVKSPKEQVVTGSVAPAPTIAPTKDVAPPVVKESKPAVSSEPAAAEDTQNNTALRVLQEANKADIPKTEKDKDIKDYLHNIFDIPASRVAKHQVSKVMDYIKSYEHIPAEEYVKNLGPILDKLTEAEKEILSTIVRKEDPNLYASLSGSGFLPRLVERKATEAASKKQQDMLAGLIEKAKNSKGSGVSLPSAEIPWQADTALRYGTKGYDDLKKNLSERFGK